MNSNSSKPSVLIVHNHYQLPGGEDVAVENEKRLLEENGHRVFLYIRNNTLPLFQKLLLPSVMFFNPRTWFDIRKIIRENNIDIVHVHNTTHVISPAVYYAAKSCGVPIVQTIHNYRMICPAGTLFRDGRICESCSGGDFKPALRHHCYRGSRLQTAAVAANMKLHRSTGIYRKLNYIVLSEFGKEKLLTFDQILPEKVYIKPNFVYPGKGPDPASKHREEYYLYAGRLEEIKGIRLLLEAFRRMPEKRLKIAGDGPLMDEIRTQVQSEKLKNIELLGWIPQDELKTLMRAAAALIICSQWYEAFSLLIIEAFAEHLPVIGGKIGNMQNLIKDKVNGLLFEYNSVQGLIDAVKAFEHCDREKLADNAHQTWLHDYSPDANYRMLSDIYGKIMKQEISMRK